MNTKVNKEDIKRYYTHCHSSLEKGWVKNQQHKGVHLGYYDEDHQGHHEAIENMTRVAAERVDIGPDDRVLCSGCGLGGPATWIAKERGADVVGINISEDQLEQCRRLAEDRNVDDRTEFLYQDFTEMSSLDDDSFDVVWGLEAICHAPDKRSFLEQAYRVLRPGGRLIVVDGFATERDPSPEGERKMRKWLEGWKLPNLAHVEDFRDHMEDLGFENIEEEDIKEDVLPSLKFMYHYSFVGYPGAKLLQLFGLRNETQIKNIVGCRYAYLSIVDDLWTYSIFTGEK